MLIATADREEQVRDLALDAAAARMLLDVSPELARDGVARKEARFRARAAESRLRNYLEDLFTPGSPDVTWRHRDKVYLLKSGRNLSELLSFLCDGVFSQPPVIRNELINRNELTAAASRARRELIEAILTGEGKENLCGADFPGLLCRFFQTGRRRTDCRRNAAPSVEENQRIYSGKQRRGDGDLE